MSQRETSDPNRPQRGAAKTARIPIKIVAREPIRKPSWIRIKTPASPEVDRLKQLLRAHGLHTVCEEASCPNLGECFRTAQPPS